MHGSAKRNDPLASGLKKVQDAADSQGMEVDSSMEIELTNYSRHVDVDNLPPEKLEKVIEGIGELSLRVARAANRERAGGGDVRATLLELCGQTFMACSNAAARVLAAEDVESIGMDVTVAARNVSDRDDDVTPGVAGA